MAEVEPDPSWADRTLTDRNDQVGEQDGVRRMTMRRRAHLCVVACLQVLTLVVALLASPARACG